jgi:hypothetical protein
LTDAHRKELEKSFATFLDSYVKKEKTPDDKDEVAAAKGPQPEDQADEVVGQDGAAEDVEAEASDENKVWCFRACQLTYNCLEGDWASSDKGILQTLFARLQAFAKQLSTLLVCIGISLTLEKSMQDQRHHHAHIYLNMKKAFRKQGKHALDVFAFEGIKPHVVANKSTGRDYDGAVRYGHFYVVCEKKGSVDWWSTFSPWQQYAVEGWWLDNLLKQNKLSRDVYLKYAARVGVGFQNHLQNIRAAERYERQAAVEAHVTAESQKLVTCIAPCKSFPVIEEFLTWFDGRAAFRRPILAIIGGTRLGKSMLAADVLRKVSKLVGTTDFLEITVEGNAELDLADFDHRRHSGVLLDGVGDALMLQRHRETLQGRPKLQKGGQSATNLYAYPFTLVNRAVVVTFDLSATNLGQLETHHWLKNPENVMRLYLKEPAWIQDQGDPLPKRARV